MTALEFDTNAAFVRCVILHQTGGKLWDAVASAWIDPPADGTVPAGCVLAPKPFATRGPLVGLWRLSLSLDATDLIGASLAIFFSDAQGRLGTRIDYWTSPYIAQVAYTRGGWSRT